MLKLIFEGETWEDILQQVRDYHENHCTVKVTITPVKPEDKVSAVQTQSANTSESGEIDDETMKKALRSHVKKHGKDSAVAILQQYDAPRASAVAQESRAECLEKLNG